MSEEKVRQITSSRELAALAHPLRRRIMDILRIDDAATASAIAARTGQAIGNVSHHLHVLAGADLIREAPELARDRRERWWRLVSRGLRWSEADFSGDPAAAAVADAAAAMNLDYHTQQVRSWFAADDDALFAWRDSAFSADRWLRLTPAELAAVSAEIVAIFDHWADRGPVPDDGDRRPVFVFAYGMPAEP